MECPRCHNQEIKYIYFFQGQYYCRKCIAFKRVFLNQKRMTIPPRYPTQNIHYQLDFDLSFQQKNISDGLLECYKCQENAYVWAVCGSGKTEIVFQTIQYALNQGHHVAFCIPRKELVQELYERLLTSFPHADIGLLYGGVKQNENAQLMICTMHQLYRYENHHGFDLMIADEVDAFPFYHNDVLEEIFLRCCVGSYIKLSATFDESDIDNGQLFVMNRRYHQHHLPVPRKLYMTQYLQKWILLVLLWRKQRRWVVYAPTIRDVESLVKFLALFHLPVEAVSSHSSHNQQRIQNLKNHDYYILVSTTILERGMTVDNVHVIVYMSEHRIFDCRTLIQIAGRVGRKPQHPTGDIWFLYSKRSKEMNRCIQVIRKLNRMNA